MSSNWCLQDINYEDVDFTLDTPKTFKVLETNAAFKLPEYLDEEVLDEETAQQYLRTAVLKYKFQVKIPEILVLWPSSTLRLCNIVSPEECRAAFNNNLRELWTWILRGLLMLSSKCNLRCLDLSNFTPDKHMLYTLVSLVPFLTFPRDQLIDPHKVFETVVNNIGIADESLKKALDLYLHAVLQHKVFHHGRKRIEIPKDQKLKLVLDFVPLSWDKTVLLSLLTALGIRPKTKVEIIPVTVQMTFKGNTTDDGEDHDAWLQESLKHFDKETLKGLSLMNIRSQGISDLLTSVACYSNLNKLALNSSSNHTTYVTEYLATDNSVLNSLKKLSRLELSHLNLTGRMSNILDSLCSPLQYLSLSCCTLLMEDIHALGDWKYAEKIIDLDVSNLTHTYETEYGKATFGSALITVICLCSGLKSLNLSHNYIAESSASKLCEVLCKLEYLKNLQILGINLSDECLIEILQKITEVPYLQKVSVTRKPRVREKTDDDQVLFLETVNKLMENQRPMIKIQSDFPED